MVLDLLYLPERLKPSLNKFLHGLLHDHEAFDKVENVADNPSRTILAPGRHGVRLRRSPPSG